MYLQGTQQELVNALMPLKDHREVQTSRSSQRPQSKTTHNQTRKNYRKKKGNWIFQTVFCYRCSGYGKKRIWTLMGGAAESLGKAWACLQVKGKDKPGKEKPKMKRKGVERALKWSGRLAGSWPRIILGLDLCSCWAQPFPPLILLIT